VLGAFGERAQVAEKIRESEARSSVGSFINQNAKRRRKKVKQAGEHNAYARLPNEAFGLVKAGLLPARDLSFDV